LAEPGASPGYYIDTVLEIELTISNRNDSYGWHFQYLTIIGLALAMLTFVFGSLADITASRRLFVVKNALSVYSAPLEILDPAGSCFCVFI